MSFKKSLSIVLVIVLMAGTLMMTGCGGSGSDSGGYHNSRSGHGMGF